MSLSRTPCRRNLCFLWSHFLASLLSRHLAAAVMTRLRRLKTVNIPARTTLNTSQPDDSYGQLQSGDNFNHGGILLPPSAVCC